MDERERMNGLARIFATPLALALIVAGSATGVVGAADTGGAAPRQITRPSRPLRSAKSGVKPNSTGGSYWQTLAVLAGIVVVIVVGAKFLKKHGPLLPGSIPNDALEVLGRRAIDRGQLIYLVRLGSRILIVGSSSSGLQTLGEVTDPVEIDYLAGTCRQSTEGSAIRQGFLTLFNRQFARSDPERDSAPAGGEHASEARSGPSLHSVSPEREQAHV
ncbi:MAG: flagellar biosynthetic protein FliO [Planctomycetaceae bacterium]